MIIANKNESNQERKQAKKQASKQARKNQARKNKGIQHARKPAIKQKK